MIYAVTCQGGQFWKKEMSDMEFNVSHYSTRHGNSIHLVRKGKSNSPEKLLSRYFLRYCCNRKAEIFVCKKANAQSYMQIKNMMIIIIFPSMILPIKNLHFVLGVSNRSMYQISKGNMRYLKLRTMIRPITTLRYKTCILLKPKPE